jgi:hypothetical protein
MDRQRFFEILCHGLTLCINEIANELTAGPVAESERPSVTKCLADLRDTQAKLRQAQAGSSITTDQAFWYNLDDALYALEETPPRFAGADELEQVRERIIYWQNELGTAHATGCARTAA